MRVLLYALRPRVITLFSTVLSPLPTILRRILFVVVLPGSDVKYKTGFHSTVGGCDFANLCVQVCLCQKDVTSSSVGRTCSAKQTDYQQLGLDPFSNYSTRCIGSIIPASS